MENKEVEYGLKSISFTKYSLHPSYARGKEIKETEAAWGMGFNWWVNTEHPEWDEVTISQQLFFYREKDHFEIAKLFIITVFHTSKNIPFSMKYKLLVELANQSAAQMQGAWRVTVKNTSICRFVAQSYNKTESMETGIKKTIYEKWE